MRLKDRTLKNFYEQRQNNGALLEAIDMQKVNASAAAIDSLVGLIPPNAAIFQTAMKAAKKELQDYAKGGLMRSIKNVVSDPLAKTTAMVSALKAGFAALPGILKLNLPPGMEKEGQKSCLELIPDPAQQKAFLSTMTKAFAPESVGSLGSDIKGLFTNNNMPYINNLTAAVQELMQNVAPSGAVKLGQQADSVQVPAPTPPAAAQPTADKAAAPSTQAAAQPNAEAGGVNAGSKSPAPTSPSASSTPSTPMGAKPAIPGGAAAPANGNAAKPIDPKVVDTLASEIAGKLKVDPKTIIPVITLLAQRGKLAV